MRVTGNTFTPHLGTSYIESPPSIRHKKTCIKIKQSDDTCFASSVVAVLHAAGRNNSKKISNYPHCSTILNLKET